MEITTLARAFPGVSYPVSVTRGYLDGPNWRGAETVPQSLARTVTAVRRLLSGEMVTIHSDQLI